MFTAIRNRLDRKEGGFTLIELMVVVLIIAILIAIAIPTFLGARKRAQDKQAQSNLRNGLTAEKTYYVDTQAYADDGVAAELTELQNIESALTWNSTVGATRGVDVNAVGSAVTVGDKGCVILQSNSKSGTNFFLLDIASGAGAGTYYGKDVAAPACPAVNTAPAAATWAASW